MLHFIMTMFVFLGNGWLLVHTETCKQREECSPVERRPVRARSRSEYSVVETDQSRSILGL